MVTAGKHPGNSERNHQSGIPNWQERASSTSGRECQQPLRAQDFRMKILIYSHVFSPSIGGVEKSVQSLAEGLGKCTAPTSMERVRLPLSRRLLRSLLTLAYSPSRSSGAQRSLISGDWFARPISYTSPVLLWCRFFLLFWHANPLL